MKTAIRVSAVVLVVVMLAMVLASCGGLSGKYRAVTGSTYEFSGNKFTYTPAIGSVQNGTYEIDEDKILLTYEDAEDAVSLPFEKGDGFIRIMGVKYEAVK